MKTVIFVHGFGVRADSRGMFGEIADAIAARGFNPVLFDLNDIIDEHHLTIPPFSQQIAKLASIYEAHKSADTYIIAHSQGCIVTALANLPGMKKTIFLAPPTDTDISKTIEYFKQNPLSTIDIDNTSKLARRDGSFTFVPKEYWQERKQLDIEDVYKKYLAGHTVSVARATLDDVISNDNLSKIFDDTHTTDIAADHDFTGASRSDLIEFCLGELVG